MKLIEGVHRKQYFRHVLANKLTLPLTVFQQLREGKSVATESTQLAIQDLEAIMRFLPDWKAKEV